MVNKACSHSLFLYIQCFNNDEDKYTSIISHTEKTEVLYGVEAAMSRLTQVMSRVSNRADVCGDSLSPSFSMGVDSINKGYID